MKLADKWFVDDWKLAKHWYVMHVNAIGFAISVVGAGIQLLSSAAAPWYGILPRWQFSVLAAALFFGGMVGRLLRQEIPPK